MQVQVLHFVENITNRIVGECKTVFILPLIVSIPNKFLMPIFNDTYDWLDSYVWLKSFIRIMLFSVSLHLLFSVCFGKWKSYIRQQGGQFNWSPCNATCRSICFPLFRTQQKYSFYTFPPSKWVHFSFRVWVNIVCVLCKYHLIVV